jgi:hypothetical protein
LPNDMLVMGVWVQIKDANSSQRCKPIRKTWQQCTTKSSSLWHYLARYNLFVPMLQVFVPIDCPRTSCPALSIAICASRHSGLQKAPK